MRRSCRLLALDQCITAPSPPRSPTPPIQASTSSLDYPTPLPLPPVPHTSHDSFQQFETDCIGNFDDEYVDNIGNFDHEFVDSQEHELQGRESSCEELEEDDFDEGLYAVDETQTPEELLWPPEMLHHPQKFKQHSSPNISQVRQGSSVGNEQGPCGEGSNSTKAGREGFSGRVGSVGSGSGLELGGPVLGLATPRLGGLGRVQKMGMLMAGKEFRLGGVS